MWKHVSIYLAYFKATIKRHWEGLTSIEEANTKGEKRAR